MREQAAVDSSGRSAGAVSAVSGPKKLYPVYAQLRRRRGQSRENRRVEVFRNGCCRRCCSLFSIERQFAKVEVAGSNPVSRSFCCSNLQHLARAIFLSNTSLTGYQSFIHFIPKIVALTECNLGRCFFVQPCGLAMTQGRFVSSSKVVDRFSFEIERQSPHQSSGVRTTTVQA